MCVCVCVCLCSVSVCFLYIPVIPHLGIFSDCGDKPQEMADDRDVALNLGHKV